ncbi:MAG: hypothetical protein ACTSQY_01695 [Candidatus Odinarchaeia archaeon]
MSKKFVVIITVGLENFEKAITGLKMASAASEHTKTIVVLQLNGVMLANKEINKKSRYLNNQASLS